MQLVWARFSCARERKRKAKRMSFEWEMGLMGVWTWMGVDWVVGLVFVLELL